MNYVAVKKTPESLSQIKPAAGEDIVKKDPDTLNAQEKIEQRVWNKYMALTSTEAQKTQQQKTLKLEDQSKPSKNYKKISTKPEIDTKPVSGIAAVLQEYEKRKAARGQMRSLSVAN